jgi:hypothetical protein
LSSVLDKIPTRGRWRVTVRAVSSFDDKRIDNISKLYPLLEDTQVQLRGWNFPHLDTHVKPHIDVKWIGQDFESDSFLEVWRFYQSGQFVWLSGMHEDWLDQSELSPAPAQWTPGATLSVLSTIYQFTEVFEFAARLADTEAGDEEMEIMVTVSGLSGRDLELKSMRYFGFPPGKYVATLQALLYEVVML